MILLIDTSQHEITFVALIGSDGRLLGQKSYKQKFQQSEKLLPLINDVLKKAKAKLTSLTGVAVVAGPGGFTCLRIGIATANALAFGLGIPVIGVPAEILSNPNSFAMLTLKLFKKARPGYAVVPRYGREPNITHKKQLGYSK